MVKAFKVKEFYNEDDEPKVKTTPKNVDQANKDLFAARINLVEAAKRTGMTPKEMKMTFFEFCKYHVPIYTRENDYTKPPERLSITITIE